MTTQEAIQKAESIDLQKELGVPIDLQKELGVPIDPASVVSKDSLIQTIPTGLAEDAPDELLVDMDHPDASEHADFYLGCLLDSTRRAMQDGGVTTLHSVNIRWVEIPDRTLRRGLYRITLLAQNPKS